MKKFKLLSIALLASLTLTGARVWADDEPTQDSSYSDAPAAVSVSDIEALNNRLSAIEKTAASGLKVDALLQFWFTNDSFGADNEVSNGSFTSSKNQWDAFSFKRAQVFLTGNVTGQIPVAYGLTIDPSQASFNGIGITQGTVLAYDGTASTAPAGAGTVAVGQVNPFTLVEDLYAKIGFSPYATLIVGQNKFAQGLEGRTAGNNLDFNNYSNIDGNNGFGNKRDTGVQLAGSGIPLGPVLGEYTVSLITGAGQSAWDNDEAKDLAARVGFTYDKNLFVGASGYTGQEVNGYRQDVGLEASWLYSGLKLQGEFITGSVDTFDNNAANNSVWTPSITGATGVPTGQINPTGYYFLASYRLGDWRLGARWDGYNYNQGGVGDQEYDTITLGLDWFEDKDALKETINWEDHLLKNGVEGYQVITLQSQVYI